MIGDGEKTIVEASVAGLVTDCGRGEMVAWGVGEILEVDGFGLSANRRDVETFVFYIDCLNN